MHFQKQLLANVLQRKVFWKISQNSQVNSRAEVSILIKWIHRLKACNLILKKIWHRCFPVFLSGAFILSRRPWEKSVWSRAMHNCWTIYLNLNILNGIFTRKAAGTFDYVHEGKSKRFKYCTPEFDGSKKISFRTGNISLLWIFIFPYTKHLVEKPLFYAQYKINFYPRSSLYMKKWISITTIYFISASQSCEKNNRRKV